VLIGFDAEVEAELWEIDQWDQERRFIGRAGATPSLLRNFSAPVLLHDDLSIEQVAKLARCDGDPVNRWMMMQRLMSAAILGIGSETPVIEAVPAATGSGAKALNMMGSEGVFYVVNNRGNVWGAGNPTTLADWDSIVSRLDKQGAIEENVVFVNREFGFAIDNMLATLNGYNGGSASGGASFGLFDNDTEMALNLGFTGFRRGYDFYKSDWKYLNDPTMRGGLYAGGSGAITGLLVPAGSTSVYDQIMGKNAKRPFLHVRYRASEAEDRRYKTWITGSAGGAATSDLDAMEVNFLSERCVCTLGANNFVLFRYGS